MSFWLCSRPAIMKLWPLFRSIDVCARRTTKPGTVIPFPISIGGRPVDRGDLRRDLERDQPVGKHGRREFEPDAEFLVVDGDLAVVAGDRDRNSPPARKLAFCPERAIRFGSASRRATPRSSSALMATSIVQPLVRSAPMISPAGALLEADGFELNDMPPSWPEIRRRRSWCRAPARPGD